MCEFPLISNELEAEMRQLVPQVSDVRFWVFQDMTRKHILDAKEDRKVINTSIKNLNGVHTVIFGTIDDAKAVLDQFTEQFGK